MSEPYKPARQTERPLERFVFEIILYFEPEWQGSINELKSQLYKELERLEDIQDVEIELTDRQGGVTL